MFTTIASAIVFTAISNSDTAQVAEKLPQPVGPTCQLAPDGANKTVTDCFDDACDIYRDAWAACGDSACKAAALTQYLIDINLCVPSHKVSNAGWVTLWQHNGEFGFSFNNTVPLGAVSYEF